MGEPLPLATIQDAILEFLRGRSDAVLFGAHAVNAYVAEPRMTQDVDMLSVRAADLADELRQHLVSRFRIAVRIRVAESEKGWRLYQVRKPKNRHLADVRLVESLPESQRIDGIAVLPPDALIASKVIAYHQRRGRPKAGTDWRDLAELLLRFPELKADPGAVTDALHAMSAEGDVLTTWKQLVAQPILPEVEDEF